MAATRIPILRNPRYKPNGLKSLIYTLRKFDITPTQGNLISRDANMRLMMRAADGTQNEVTADNQQNDAFFTAPVQVGTPPQTLQLTFDSGSADTWFWSTELPPAVVNNGIQVGNTVFNPDKSSTFKKTPGSTWQIQYGDQSTASGTVGTDKLKIGDIIVENQAIELADKLSDQFQQSFGSGLLGLSFGSINTVKPTPVKTPVENMVAQKDIPADKELFTCYLGSVKDVADPDKGESFYTFGAIDNDVIKAAGQDVHYTPIDNSQGFWMFDSNIATVNGQTVSVPGNKAIADTGTTLLMASPQLCDAVYNQITGARFDEGQGGYIFPASTPTDELPEVTVDVGGKQFTIEKEHLAWAPVDESGTMIFGGIQPRGNIDFDIFGDTFLMCVYGIFDVGKKQFGCVQRADPTPSGPKSAGEKIKSGLKKAGKLLGQHGI